MNYIDKIKELEAEIENLKQVAEQLVVVAFSISELRDLWRKKFGLPTKSQDNGDMP